MPMGHNQEAEAIENPIDWPTLFPCNINLVIEERVFSYLMDTGDSPNHSYSGHIYVLGKKNLYS